MADSLWMFVLCLALPGCMASFDRDFDFDGDGSTTAMDCDDGDAGVNPVAAEVCANGVDEDCDGLDLDCDEDAGEDETPEGNNGNHGNGNNGNGTNGAATADEASSGNAKNPDKTPSNSDD